MSNKRIGTTLTTAFAVLLAILAGIGWLGLSRMSQRNAELRNIAEYHWNKARLAAEAMQYSNTNNRITMQILLADRPEEINALIALRTENSAKISEILRKLHAKVDCDKEREALDAVEQARTPYVNSYKRLNLLVTKNERREAKQKMLSTVLPLLMKYHAAWAEFVQYQDDDLDHDIKESQVQYGSAYKLTLYLISAGLFISVCIAVLITRKMVVEIAQRERAETRVILLNQDLERKVNERTAALSKSNESLTNEIAVRIQAEKELRLLSTAVEQSPVAVVITDPQGNITYVNHKFTECSGYSAEEAVGQNPRILKSGYTSPADYKKLWDAITEGQTWRGEFHNRKKTGEMYWESALITPIDDTNGTVSHFLAIKEDITERRELENQLQQANKLEAIGQLAAGMAHEINTPIQFVGNNTTFIKDASASLAPILSALGQWWESRADTSHGSLALKQLETCYEGALRNGDIECFEKEIPKALDETLQGIERVAEIVRVMKEFADPGSKGKVAVDLSHSIETTIAVAQSQWKPVAEMETAFAADLPPVLCYASELNQVMFNLITNAAHAIGEVVGDGATTKGKITITTCLDGPFARISVADTGAGIPQEVRWRIFEPFFTTKPLGRGVGQGLAMAHHSIVKKHGGKIWLQSEVGKGTTFHVQLPLKPVAAVEASNGASAEHSTVAGS